MLECLAKENKLISRRTVAYRTTIFFLLFFCAQIFDLNNEQKQDNEFL